MDLIFLSLAILICAALLFVAINLTKPHKIQLDKEKFQGSWLKIENSIKRDEPATWHLALINADKLVDTALRELQFSGQTMGERLKNAKDKLSSPNSIWHAHKLRNVIAHEPDAEINYDQTRRAMNSFKQALKDLGAI
ncbi:MAG: hypothetical protein Q4A27_01890 [bacterium]|nr:hypothetical protein [bacterium]